MAAALATIVVMSTAADAHSANDPALAATVIDGAQAYTPAEFFAVYRDRLGRPINRENAQAIVAQIEAMYLRDGYSRPEFRLDAELADSGVLRIEVIEARVTQVVINGDAGPHAARLAALSEELRLRVPVRATDVKVTLQQMRELPGLEIRATTRKDELQRNGHVVLIEAAYKPLDGLVQLTNRGTREVGRNFIIGQLTGNGLLGHEERLGLLLFVAADRHEHAGGGVFFDLPVGARGMHLTATTFASRSDPSETPDRDIVFERERTALRVTRPVVAGTTFKLTFSGGLDADNLTIRLDGGRLRSEKLRVVELGARIAGRAGPATQYLVALQSRHGLDRLGSELEARDLAQDPRRKDFVITRLQYTQLTKFATHWAVRFDVLGQHSAYVLPDTERYKIGGERLGRGFEVARISGDQGIGTKAELRRELTGASTDIGRTSIYGFYDFGAAWKQNAPGRESATTAGLGLGIEYGRLSGFVEIAKPLTHADVEGDRGAKVFVGLSARL